MSTGEYSGQFVDLLKAGMQACGLEYVTREFRSGEVIFEEGDPGDGLYVIDEGSVQISAMLGQKVRHVLCNFNEGEFFGELAVIDDQARSATASAITKCRLSFVTTSQMMTVMKSSPWVSVTLMRVGSHRLRSFNHQFILEMMAADRLATFGRFARSIVHDLKNPLYIIGMAGDLAASANVTHEIRQEAQGRIHEQVDRLTRMLDEMLRMTEGPVPQSLKPTIYAEYIQSVIGEVEDEMRSRGIAFELENPAPTVMVGLNATRMHHAFINLFNNAADFMSRGGRLMLRFQSSKDEVTTEIEDTGTGFGDGVAAKLFTPFFTQGKPNGTGIGLSICKNIVEDHGGRIWAKAESGRGGIFCISLPICE